MKIFKNIMDVPGDICEFGVFKGSGIFTWVKLIRSLNQIMILMLLVLIFLKKRLP